MSTMSPSDRHYPFFEPFWRRAAVIVVVALWFGFEVLYSRELLWMTIAGGMLAYSFWMFILKWPKEPDEPAA